jgi:serine/threonine protein kinase
MNETTVDRSVAPLQAGDPRRLGSYELIGRLGIGGQGAVFLGTSEPGGRVAVKLLHSNLTEDTDARGRFVREAMAAKRVARFCAAQVLDVQVAGDQPYIVTEYVPGPSLQRLVKDGGPLSGGALERLAIGTATALVAIHQAGVVHRDLKPANVIVGPDGPRVIDFGIAKALATTATASSRVLGTPAYMAPEQVRGVAIDTAVDVFAWGAMMVFVATGWPPFGTDSIPLVVERVLSGEPDLGAMAEPLRALVCDCLAKDSALRPTARQLLLRLLGQDEPAPMAARGDAMAAAVGADVLAQATTLAAPVAAIAEMAAANGMTAANGTVPATATAPVTGPALGHGVPQESRAPVAKRSGLSRAFVAAGLASVMVAIATLILMFAWPDDPKFPARSTETPSTQRSPVSEQQQSTQSNVPQGTLRSQPATTSSGGSSSDETDGTGSGTSDHGGYPGNGDDTDTDTEGSPSDQTGTPTPNTTPSTTGGGNTDGGGEDDGQGGYPAESTDSH